MSTLLYCGEDADYVVGQCLSCRKKIEVKRENADLALRGFDIVPTPIKCSCGQVFNRISARNYKYKDPTPKVSTVSSKVKGDYHLVKCPVCRKDISSQADICINCGHPMHIDIKCKNCNSTEIIKISDVSKMGSAFLFGIFSLGKLSKTYECKKCGYRW